MMKALTLVMKIEWRKINSFLFIEVTKNFRFKILV